MQVINSASEAQKVVSEIRGRGKRIAFVPTMGALHEGHLSLMRLAKEQGDFRVVSVFVNPTQFNQASDFEKYPRTLETDLAACETEGTDLVFAPSVKEMYPDGLVKNGPVPEAALPMEGSQRPGHFAGVCTVVRRLFEIVQPHTAIFGEKDYQQLLVIRQMVKEQKLTVQIVGHPTVRNENGLALSSRNERLTEKGKKRALAIPDAIRSAQALFQKGEKDAEKLVHTARQRLTGLSTDYVTVADAETLELVSHVKGPARLFIAACVEGIRLIDNDALI